MTGERRAWTPQGEVFWRAHHEEWKRSDLNQRECCEVHCLPQKAFENWRQQFRAEPQLPERKLLYRRGGLGHRLSQTVTGESPLRCFDLSFECPDPAVYVVALPAQGRGDLQVCHRADVLSADASRLAANAAGEKTFAHRERRRLFLPERERSCDCIGDALRFVDDLGPAGH